MFASAIRPPGLIVGACVVLAYALDWIQQRHPLRWNVLAPALTPLGTIAYLLYCWVRFGDPLAYVKASQQGWHGGQLQLNTIRWFLYLLTHPSDWIVSGDFSTIIWSIYALICVAGLIGVVFVYRKLGPVYAFFTLASIVASVVSYPIPTSTGRYVSVVFPLFTVLALYLRSKLALRDVVIIGFSFFLALFTFLFVIGSPVY
jgi:hypothetical protein